MPEYPNASFPPDLVGVLAGYFAGGRGPSHSNIASAVAAAGVGIGNAVYPNKETRVHGAFQLAANAYQRFRLADELLVLLRNDDAFGAREDTEAWSKRARAAFKRAGWPIDDEGYADWMPPPSKPMSGTNDWDEFNRKNPNLFKSTSARARQPAPRPPKVEQAETSPPASKRQEPPTPKVFLVHGHDTAARHEVESFISRTTGIIPTVLMLEASAGLTVIEKFEKYADKSAYAVVLMNPDDVGQAVADAECDVPPKPRARQNVVFEFGYFVGYLQRSHVAALVSPGVERPSDIAGVVYIEFVPGSSNWKEELRREMREAKIPIVN